MTIDEALPWVVGLLGLAVVLLVIVALLLWRLGSLVKGGRIPRGAEGGREASSATPGVDETRARHQLFGKFLEEDPARAQLPKREQFEAFRRWRQQKGYNWGGRSDEADLSA